MLKYCNKTQGEYNTMQKYYDNLCIIGDLILDNPIDGEQVEGEMRLRSESGGVTINGDKIVTEPAQLPWTKITGVPEFTATSLDWSNLKNVPSQVIDLTTGMYVEAMALGAPFGVATLDTNGKLSEDQFPSKLLTDVYIVASQTAMLSLSNAKQGDFAIRTDINKTFVLGVDGYSTIENWKELLSPPMSLGYTALNKAGDNILGSLSFPKTAGIGIKIEDQYGWRDLIGDVAPKYGSGVAPAQAVFLPSVRGWAYSANDQFECVFHIPHDYAPGTDLYLHMHWAHNGTNISGTFKTDMFVTYSKGHNQSTFSPAINVPITISGLTIQNTPQYLHRIDEVQLSAIGGAANKLNTNLIEVDGLILISGVTSIIPSISGSASSNRPFIFTVDVHYQSTGVSTKNKSPNFYG